MEELLKNKLEAARELRSFTKEIMSMSPKTEYGRVSSTLGERQQHIEKINNINKKINEAEIAGGLPESTEIKSLKREIRGVFREIAEMDNLIRKKLNSELKSVKIILNQPEALTKSLNIKA